MRQVQHLALSGAVQRANQRNHGSTGAEGTASQILDRLLLIQAHMDVLLAAEPEHEPVSQRNQQALLIEFSRQ